MSGRFPFVKNPLFVLCVEIASTGDVLLTQEDFPAGSPGSVVLK